MVWYRHDIGWWNLLQSHQDNRKHFRGQTCRCPWRIVRASSQWMFHDVSGLDMIWIKLLPGGKNEHSEISRIIRGPPSIAKELSANVDTTSQLDAMYDIYAIGWLCHFGIGWGTYHAGDWDYFHADVLVYVLCVVSSSFVPWTLRMFLHDLSSGIACVLSCIVPCPHTFVHVYSFLGSIPS